MMHIAVQTWRSALGKAVFWLPFALVPSAWVCDAQEPAGISHLCALPAVDVNGCPGA